MLQSINCIRSGQVLLDENLEVFILCNNCHRDTRNLHEFRKHLENCEGIQKYFQKQTKFKYSSDKSTQLIGKTEKGIKEVSFVCFLFILNEISMLILAVSHI